MSVCAAFAVFLMALPTPPSVNQINAVPLQTANPPQFAPANPNWHVPQPTTSDARRTKTNHRTRTPAALNRRRDRAVAKGFQQPKPNKSTHAFIEVPRMLRRQAKDMINGKILKDLRKTQLGFPAHSTRTASLQAYQQKLISNAQFKMDARTIKKQNHANHRSNIKSTRWADMYDEDTLTKAQMIADIVHQKLCQTIGPLSEPKAPPPNDPNVQRVVNNAPPSPPFSYRSDTNSYRSSPHVPRGPSRTQFPQFPRNSANTKQPNSRFSTCSASPFARSPQTKNSHLLKSCPTSKP